MCFSQQGHLVDFALFSTGFVMKKPPFTLKFACQFGGLLLMVLGWLAAMAWLWSRYA